MPIPDFQTTMLPLLKALEDGKEHRMRDVTEHLAGEFNLTEDERVQLLPSGTQQIFDNRVGWAKSYFKKAGLIDSPQRGIAVITQRGIDVLKQNLDKINVKFLLQYPEFVAFQKQKKDTEQGRDDETIQTDRTPFEVMDSAYEQIRQAIVGELLERIVALPPAFFERLVVELLVKMGYGGSIQDAGKSIGRSGDEGIDGIIKEDKLGLDIIYVQAKRWENSVPVKELRDFVDNEIEGVHPIKKNIEDHEEGFCHTCDVLTELRTRLFLDEVKE